MKGMCCIRIFLLLVVLAVPALSLGSSLDDYYLARFHEAYSRTGETTTARAKEIAASGVTAGCLTPLHHALRRDWKQLQSSTQTALAKYLEKPALAGEAVVLSNGGHFSVHYATTGADAPPLADGNGNGIPDWIETVATVMEAVYSREVQGFGYAPPPTAGGAPYDIYLQNLGTYFGQTTSIMPIANGSTSFTSYIVLDNDFAEAAFGDYTGLKGLEITAAHEFHHAIQYGYNFYFDIWYGEVTSTWMENEVYGTIKQLYSYLSPYFSHTTLPLNADVSVATGGGYGRWLFNRYLGESFSTQPIIREVWETLATKSPVNEADIPMLPVLDQVLSQKGSSLAGAFFGFSQKFLLRDWKSHQEDLNWIPQLSIAPGNSIAVNSSFALPAVSLPLYSFTWFKLSPTPGSLTVTYTRPAGYAVAAFLYAPDGSGSSVPFDTTTGVLSLSSVTLGDVLYLLVCNNGSGAVTVPAGPSTAIVTQADATNPYTGAATLVSVPPAPVAAAGGGGGGCFIATAAYGSYLHPKVRLLRDFRDRYLVTNAPGRAFVRLYYTISPPIAETIARHEVLRLICRVLLTPLLYGLQFPLLSLLFIIVPLSRFYRRYPR